MIAKEKVHNIIYIFKMAGKKETEQYLMTLSYEELIDTCVLMVIGRNNDVNMKNFQLERESFEECHQDTTKEQLARYLKSKKPLADYLGKSLALYLDEEFVF